MRTLDASGLNQVYGGFNSKQCAKQIVHLSELYGSVGALAGPLGFIVGWIDGGYTAAKHDTSCKKS